MDGGIGMLYSFMNAGENNYVHLHGEQAVRKVKSGCAVAVRNAVLTGEYILDALQELSEEGLRGERLILDFGGVGDVEEQVKEALADLFAQLKEADNRLYLIRMSEAVKDIMSAILQEEEIVFREEQGEEEDWYCITDDSEEKMSPEECLKLAESIHVDNLMILVEDGPKGKSMDIRRLLDDGEYCVYYFIYRLAVKLVKEKLVSPEPAENGDICLIPDNASAEYICNELAAILGVKVQGEAALKRIRKVQYRYLIVRDVIHMFCELNRLSAVLASKGTEPEGSVCLLDINTGVGSRKNRVSFHTIDMEKGISYRIRQKQEKLLSSKG